MNLTIVLIREEASAARAALTIALAQAALGGRVRMFGHERAAALLASAPHADDETRALAEHGLPDRLALLAMAAEAGIELIACQTGLAILGLTAADLANGVSTGGLVGMLATLGDDRLVMV